jgi:hypothetical protein
MPSQKIRFINHEFKQSDIRSRQDLLFFFQTGQKASPFEKNFYFFFNPVFAGAAGAAVFGFPFASPIAPIM